MDLFLVAVVVVTSVIAGVGIWMASLPTRTLTIAGRQLVIEVIAEGDAFVARCRNPEVASDGKTERESAENLREALELYFESDETQL